MRIEKIIGIDSLTLLIYYTKAHCWQFEVIEKNARLWQPKKIFYTANAAEEDGRKWIRDRLTNS